MHRQSLLPFLSLIAHLAAGQDTITDAPSAPEVTGKVTIWSGLDYTLQRSCVAHCIYYNGPLPRGAYYHDWDDVGGELGCGYAPINGCYCNTKYSSSASSYFSSCIPYYCGTANPDPQDLVSALSMYNAYCATANGNPTKPVPEPVSAQVTSRAANSPASSADASTPETENAKTAPPTSTAAGATGGSGSGGSSGTAAGASSTNSAEAESKESGSGDSMGGGLTKGAKIGIAVGASLGGVALIAIGVASFLLYKRRAVNMKEPPMGGIQEGY
ncbi:hypothetical protein TWF696_006732 [Orbilia brochopaga]|uniref:Uncharacterized protein n=1 Tax=Orbilia brochopaga TaxID=3140254 RepID=A0AAV9UT20_9PEZI